MKRLISWKNFVLALFMLFVAPVAIAKDISFVQVTDVHYNQEHKDILDKAVKDINSLEGLDFVVFTGDNIDVSNKKDLEAFLKEVKGLNYPYYILVGNHDVYKRHGVAADEYMKLVKKSAGAYHPDTPNYVFKKNGYIFVVINGAKENIPGANAYFKPSTLEWLDQTLTKYSQNNVIIFQHFPLLEARSDGHNIYNKNEYLNVLKKHSNVKAIVSGHYHENREEMVNGIYNIVTPSLGVSKVYKLIDIDTTINFVYTMLKNFD